MASGFGGPDDLMVKFVAVLEHYLDNYPHKKKNVAAVTDIESKLLPKSTIDAIDFVLMQNDAERLDEFLRGAATFRKPKRFSPISDGKRQHDQAD